jgi:hypothetical protein
MFNWILNNRQSRREIRAERARARAALPSSPPGAGGRLLDLYTPMPPR